jgi:drug/metabolite transporter (DMT)-like permease
MEATNATRTGYKTFAIDDRESCEATSQACSAPPPPPPPRSLLFQAGVIGGLLLSVLCGSIGSAAVQVLNGAVPEFQLNAWRFAVQWLLMIPVVIIRGCELKIPCKKLPLMGLTILLLNAVNVFLFTAYIYLPLGLADGLTNAVILTGNAALSICIKTDRKLTLYLGAVLCLIGLVLMVQPEFIFSGVDLPPPPVTNWTSPCVGNVIRMSSTGTTGQSATPTRIGLPPDVLGYVFALIASGLIIAYYHAISRLVSDVDPFSFSYWNAVVGSLLSVLLMVSFEEVTFLPPGMCLGLLLLHCLGTSAASVAPAWCLKYITPSVCAMITTSKMGIMVGFQYTLLADVQPGLHNWLEVFGAVLCFCGMLGGPLTEIINAHQRRSSITMEI